MRLAETRFFQGLVNAFLKFALTAPGRWFVSNYSARFDPIVYRMSGGRFNASGVIVIPMLALTTKGRKSGKKRTVQLAYVAFDGSAYVVASNFGKERHPAWMYNIEANPNVSVQLGRYHHEITAERLDEAEKAAVWDRLVAQVPNYGPYEERSGRDLRVYRLRVLGVEDTPRR